MIFSFCFSPSQNNFTGIVDLPEGEHQYKFFVDGHWTLDPKKVNMMHKMQEEQKIHQSNFFVIFFPPRKNTFS